MGKNGHVFKAAQLHGEKALLVHMAATASALSLGGENLSPFPGAAASSGVLSQWPRETHRQNVLGR